MIKEFGVKEPLLERVASVARLHVHFVVEAVVCRALDQREAAVRLPPAHLDWTDHVRIQEPAALPVAGGRCCVALFNAD